MGRCAGCGASSTAGHVRRSAGRGQQMPMQGYRAKRHEAHPPLETAASQLRLWSPKASGLAVRCSPQCWAWPDAGDRSVGLGRPGKGSAPEARGTALRPACAMGSIVHAVEALRPPMPWWTGWLGHVAPLRPPAPFGRAADGEAPGFLPAPPIRDSSRNLRLCIARSGMSVPNLNFRTYYISIGDHEAPRKAFAAMQKRKKLSEGPGAARQRARLGA